MYFKQSLIASLLATMTYAQSPSHPTITATPCGSNSSCPTGQYCTTATFHTPSTTYITTCVPTPTCLTVYSDCISGGGGPICCSGYCAATKCRSTDSNWPECSEDGGVCRDDGDCCYGNNCEDGLCVRD
ncbi:hypothetical protein M747DRAFT_70373 [Aspergillus niger ATCC 13496]|uniref:Uncharacterized protein n=1 Tax=Aspergillus niger ATCC 13496 TaxID=1353008 RepID=A0A370BZW2_ASPNG|nr:hypothetical protein M747DRAFT_70373 [Aspergillus niger ATCC 13496]